MERRRVTRWAAPVAFLVAVTILALVLRAGFEHGKQHATRTTSVISKNKKKTHTHDHPKQHVQTYTVESGDTFESIATKTGTTIAKLKQLNPSVDPNTLQVGETIKVQ